MDTERSHNSIPFDHSGRWDLMEMKMRYWIVLRTPVSIRQALAFERIRAFSKELGLLLAWQFIGFRIARLR